MRRKRKKTEKEQKHTKREQKETASTRKQKTIKDCEQQNGQEHPK